MKDLNKILLIVLLVSLLLKHIQFNAQAKRWGQEFYQHYLRPVHVFFLAEAHRKFLNPKCLLQTNV